MKIVILGGTGLIGGKLVNLFRAGGHEVIPASPSLGINSITREGLTEALTGAQVVVDVTNAPSWEDKAVLEFFETSTGNVLATEAKTGVGHHVALSIVGCDRLPASGYLRAKVAQEKLIKASPIPYTIVRATQFFEFVGGIADSATNGQAVRMPSALFQPILSNDVAAALATIAVAKPLNGIVELAGPDAIPFDEVIREYLTAHNDPRTVVTDEQARYFGTPLEKRSLVPERENPLLGSVRFVDWLGRTAPRH
ncbi:MAG: SDR family oxidoreductase [Candidatus Udaeobacter sp.]